MFIQRDDSMRLEHLFLERHHYSTLRQHDVTDVMVFNVDMTPGRLPYLINEFLHDPWQLLSQDIPYTG